jgi:NAD(P)-dependent dehydrogenase (short-subunit alcohol dehydrogenase family)
MEQRTALVTGGNRGLGFETSRQLGRLGHRIVLGARDAARGEEAAETLRGEGIDVTVFELDVSSDESCARLRDLDGIDVLVNNAGFTADDDSSALRVPVDTLRDVFETNTYGAYRVTQVLAPGMRGRGWGRIVNVSSGMGQLSDMWGGYPAYRLSKAGINVLTRVFANELQDTGVLVNSVCPGWVRTDMGGPSARLSVEEGVETIVWAATLPDDGPTGGFFRYKQPIPW